MDGMLDADEAYFKEHGVPLFSSHMLDLSEESKEENIATCVKYFERMAKMNRGPPSPRSGSPWTQRTDQAACFLPCRVARDGDRHHRR
jgi:hypothetical protein